MFSVESFATKFAEDKTINLMFFNEYKAVVDFIDKHLANPDLFDITEEYDCSDHTAYRCDISLNTCCTIEAVLAKVVEDYKKVGWKVECTFSGVFHFQTFIHVDKASGVTKIVT